MLRKRLLSLLIITAILCMSGCSSKTNDNQNIKLLSEGFQQSMVKYFDIKSIQENSMLTTQVNDNFKKLEDSKTKLEQLSGLNEAVTDQKIKAELTTFINLGKERINLSLKYLEDIKKDYDYKLKKQNADVNINSYIYNISNQLLELEYKSEQSAKRLNSLLTTK